MVPKPGRDPTYAANYRPISLLAAIGKIYEKYIHFYLIQELDTKSFMNPNQAGFTKGRSTQEHLLRLSQDISNGFKERSCTLGLFLDVKSAFDAVWKNGLKHKINLIGLSKQLENILHSYLDNRTLRVFLNGTWSEVVHLRAGTPQGGVLSPVLYLIYVNDMMESLDTSNMSVSQYADDAGLWLTRKDVKTAKEAIQNEVRKLEKWCHRWHVTLHPAKSKLVLFTKCFRHKSEATSINLSITVFEETVVPAPDAMFLGVTFDPRLTWEPQTRKILTKSYKQLNLIRQISSLSKKPNPNNLLKIYTATIRSILEYSSLCIISAASCHLDKLQLLQNQALRLILSVPSYVSTKDLHDSAGIPYIKDHLKEFAKTRFQAIERSSPLISKTIQEYYRVKHIHENASTLDVLGI